MKMHAVAVDFFKKQLTICWDLGDERDELAAYQNISQEYFYMGDLKKMRLYEDRFMKGKLEYESSIQRKAAVVKLRRQQPTFNVF